MDKINQLEKAGCFDAILESSAYVVMGISVTFSVVAFNKSAENLFGIKQKMALNKNCFELFARKGIKAPITSNYFDHPLLQSVKTDYLDKSERPLSLAWEIIPVFSETNKHKVEFAFLLAQITGQNEERDRIAKNLNQIVNCTPGSLYWKDKAGRYLGCNLFMVQTSGLNSLNDVIGKTDVELWSESAGKIRKNDLYVIKSGKTVFFDEEVRIPSGEMLYFTGVKMPLKNEQNEIVGVIGNSLDITKLKKTEEELRLAKEEAEAANQLKMEFIRNMHHDIRTPFSGIVGLTDSLLFKETDSEKREVLGYILNSGKELLSFCNNILDFSKAEMGVLPVLSKSFNLPNLLDRIVLMETPAVQLKNLKLTVNYDRNAPKIIIGDSYRLERILINLVSNAIKFTEKGYIKVSVHLEKTENKNRRFVFKFMIEDTGIGIPNDKKDLIYERFSKVNPSNQGVYRGQGLGLRIVKQFLDEMDGDIHLKSKANKGSTFTLLLPFKKPLTDGILDER